MFYYAEERVVFMTQEDARRYFHEHSMHELYDDSFTFDEFLDKHYRISDVFRMTEDEKESIIDDYYDYLFDFWFDEDIVRVEVYEGV